MSDSTISALPSASTPLAGTELVPVVQSFQTRKVAVSDLTVPGGLSYQVQFSDPSTGKLGGMANVEEREGDLSFRYRTTLPNAPVQQRDVTLFARNHAYRPTMGLKPGRGWVSDIQEHFITDRPAYALPVGNTTTLSVFGIAITAVGTASAASFTASTLHLSSRRLNYLVTTAATSAIAGFRGSQQQYWRGNAADLGGFYCVIRWGPATGAATATKRGFTGLRGATTAQTDVNPSTLTNIVGVGWDNGDANFQFMYNDATGTAVKVSTGIAVPTADQTGVFEVRIFSAPNGSSIFIEFERIDTGAKAEHETTTDIPGNNVFLNPYGWMSVGGTSSVVGYALFGLYIAAPN